MTGKTKHEELQCNKGNKAALLINTEKIIYANTNIHCSVQIIPKSHICAAVLQLAQHTQSCSYV